MLVVIDASANYCIPIAVSHDRRLGSISVIGLIELRFGLPLDRLQRLPKAYRPTDHDGITSWFLRSITLKRRLSPAVSREESERVLRYWRMWSSP